jgi:hypothetical protein
MDLPPQGREVEMISTRKGSDEQVILNPLSSKLGEKLSSPNFFEAAPQEISIDHAMAKLSDNDAQPRRSSDRGPPDHFE